MNEEMIVTNKVDAIEEEIVIDRRKGEQIKSLI